MLSLKRPDRGRFPFRNENLSKQLPAASQQRTSRLPEDYSGFPAHEDAPPLGPPTRRRAHVLGNRTDSPKQELQGHTSASVPVFPGSLSGPEYAGTGGGFVPEASITAVFVRTDSTAGFQDSGRSVHVKTGRTRAGKTGKAAWGVKGNAAPAPVVLQEPEYRCSQKAFGHILPSQSARFS